jgi:hypothetical protein
MGASSQAQPLAQLFTCRPGVGRGPSFNAHHNRKKNKPSPTPPARFTSGRQAKSGASHHRTTTSPQQRMLKPLAQLSTRRMGASSQAQPLAQLSACRPGVGRGPSFNAHHNRKKKTKPGRTQSGVMFVGTPSSPQSLNRTQPINTSTDAHNNETNLFQTATSTRHLIDCTLGRITQLLRADHPRRHYPADREHQQTFARQPRESDHAALPRTKQRDTKQRRHAVAERPCR